MWLWVLLYAIGAGFILLVCAFFTVLLPGHYLVSVIASKIWYISFMIALIALMCGFWVLIAGFVLLLIRSKFSAGRVVSLIGMWVYYIAALGFFLAAAMSEGKFWENIGFAFAIVVVPVFLPGFFIMRKFRRLQKAENIET
jgi:hypothetical protein